MQRLRSLTSLAVASCAIAAGITSMTAGAAAAVTPEDGQVLLISPGAPVPVAASEFGYTATHDLTKRASQIDLAEFVASIPVPPQYKAANLAFAARFDQTVAAALTSPGGCLQVVVDPRPTSGGLFDYGFFPVAGEYCD